jgi:RNA polymerase sigma-70 factor (ECF subfamily)
MTIVQATDAELWAKAVNGTEAAFGVLFDRHAKAVYNHCFRVTASWVMAEDATQSTFLIAWRKRDQVRLVNGSVLPWLLSVATNVVRDERRSARRWLAALLRMPPDRDTAVEVADLVADRVDDVRGVRAVLRAVRHLPRAEREALMLCVWSSVSYADAVGHRCVSRRPGWRWLPAPPSRGSASDGSERAALSKLDSSPWLPGPISTENAGSTDMDGGYVDVAGRVSGRVARVVLDDGAGHQSTARLDRQPALGQPDDRCYTDPAGNLVNPTSNYKFDLAYTSNKGRCKPAEPWSRNNSAQSTPG